jgi:aryl-alcohol dehydrogenase-like predicted oxidoreductase
MIHYKLGLSGVDISPIGLGCWQFSNGKGIMGGYWDPMPQDQIDKVVKASFENGINWFDTAEAYGWGTSEQNLRKALDNSWIDPDDVFIADKWFPIFRTSRSIKKTIDERIKAMGNYPIGLYQVHNPFSFSSVESEMRAMTKLVQNGSIGYAGISNYNAKGMRRAFDELKKYGLKLVSNQVQFNLLDRKIERNGVLDTAKELGITIIAYSPLAQGILTGKYHENPELIKSKKGPRRFLKDFRRSGLEKSRPLIEALKQIGEKYGVSSAQVALNWTVNYHGRYVVAIPGASSVKHAVSNADALKFSLTKEELEKLAGFSIS